MSAALETILIIEDDELLTRSLERLLRPEYETIRVAQQGAKGLEILQATVFDLVLLDLLLPEVNGFEILKYMQEHQPDVFVIVITAIPDEESHIQALDAGADLVLHKPV
ncbi:hypothetical protein LCGC14_1796630, partial [marine sediment metagenome]